jgi:alginate O-acetyltransferase complex protein AlgI
MVFSSVEFLFFFLPLTLAAVFVTPERARNHVLLAASLLFYLWGGGALILLLLVAIVANYLAGKAVAAGLARGDDRLRNLGVAASVVVSLGMLSYFKYANFVVDQLNDAGDALGVGPIAWTSITLPIGISFYTFQAMSYTLDLARGRAEPVRSLFDFALYVSLFPQLIAGPIVRFHVIAEELRERHTRLDDVAEGAVRFVWGLSKKVLIADTLAPVADAAFDQGQGELSIVGAWIGLLAYGFQIYFDFSGYSDMAIGMGRMLGFRFPENFARPYSALSITDFWRRWHITLSTWFRDYLYVPLGGNRGTALRTNLNLVIVFVATGIWHGAAWTFLGWGLLHGATLLWERWRGTRYVEEAPNPGLARARTLLLVLLFWVIFRSKSVDRAIAYWYSLVGGGSGVVSGDVVFTSIDLPALLALAVGTATLFLGGKTLLGAKVSAGASRRRDLARAGLFVVVFPLTLMTVLSDTFSPFLYFQF